MTNQITEQVRDGLENKIKGIENALLFVQDPREIERLKKELSEANKALAKLNKKDTRSAEEIEKISKLLNNASKAEFETPWAEKTPIDKFKYQVDLYLDRLHDTKSKAVTQEDTLKKVIKHLKSTKGDAEFIQPIIDQFEDSLAEVTFSRKNIEEQLKWADQAVQLVQDGNFFDKLVLINKFLNNPMSLPHLSEEYDKKLGELRNAKKR